MKKYLFCIVTAMICVGFTMSAQGKMGKNRVEEEPDSVLLFEEEWEVDSTAVEVVDADELLDSTYVEEEICQTDDELLSDFNVKEADFKYQNKANANTGIEFTANIFVPSELKDESGYNRMVSNVLQATLPENNQSVWKTENIDKMLENKWKIVKEAYILDMKEWENNSNNQSDDEEDVYYPSYSYNVSIMPAWRWNAAGGLTTYKVDEDVYLGGAHGMPYCYYLTFCNQTNALLGLADIFKKEYLSAVFDLVSKKLASYQSRYNDEISEMSDDVWKPEASLDGEPKNHYTQIKADAIEVYQGKCYPRPALTQCGVLFSYAPYEKDCFAAGTIEILLPFDEIAPYLKIRM